MTYLKVDRLMRKEVVVAVIVLIVVPRVGVATTIPFIVPWS